MDFSATKLLVFLVLFSDFAVRAEDSAGIGISTDTSFNGAKSYGPATSLRSNSQSTHTNSTGSLSSDNTSTGSGSTDDFSSSFLSTDNGPDEQSPPASSAVANIGPLLSLIQPILTGILNGQNENENGVTYAPLLKPLFSPLPILQGFGVLPASLAAQGSDLLANAAASAREKFAKAARENAARSQVNYGHILTAINELNMPLDDNVDSRK